MNRHKDFQNEMFRLINPKHNRRKQQWTVT